MKESEIIEEFNMFAGEYNEIVMNELGYQAYRIIPDLLLKHCRIKDAVVLDLGCGTGISSLSFFEQNFSVYGIDLSEEMLKAAAELPFKDLMCRNIENPLPFPENSFDIVTAVGVTEFINSPINLLSNISKVLKTDGLLGITFPVSENQRKEIRSYNPPQIKKLFSESGFEICGETIFRGYKNEESEIEYFGAAARLTH